MRFLAPIFDTNLSSIFNVLTQHICLLYFNDEQRHRDVGFAAGVPAQAQVFGQCKSLPVFTDF